VTVEKVLRNVVDKKVKETVVKNLYDPDTKRVAVIVKSWEVRIDVTFSAASDRSLILDRA
jgi:hypothetical protein